MLPIRADEIDEAVAALKRGDLVGLPTETVYGLAGDARNTQALARIFATKGRPADHPLIVHVADVSQLEHWAVDIPAAALRLADAFWPGPMTLILKRKPDVSDLVTGGQDTVGVRVPSHPWAQAVLRAFGGGLAAPSANRFGHVSPTTAQHVRDEFGDAVPVVLDGGPCQVGIESTIVDLSGPKPRILRPGRIAPAEIEAILGPDVFTTTEPAAGASPRVSGSLASHYAPRTSTELVDRSRLPARYRELHADDETARVLSIGPLPSSMQGLGLPADAEGYARHLYAALRMLDIEGADRILIEAPPADASWAQCATGCNVQQPRVIRISKAVDRPFR
ncbi:MAG: threonylcarbamoyl-AMP synthase [Ahniella sp.]|nr:threonylcarbamoyl-AMP synthase [Ahniella sp.]